MSEIERIDWNPLRSSTGAPGRIVAELLQAVESGDGSVYPELFEQVCHQFSLDTASFAAAVVLVSHARELEPAGRVWPLRIVGAIEASRVAHKRYGPRVPGPIEAKYQQATQKALSLAASALAENRIDTEDSFSLLATVAALQGHANIALHLFLCPDSSSLSCPECGEYINFKDV